MNDRVVKYHNDVNNIKLGTLTERELDIFISLMFTMQKQDVKEITIKFSEINNIIETTSRSSKYLTKSILKVNQKLIRLNRTIKTERGYLTFNLFERLEVFEDTREVTIKITETFKYMLNDLLGNFTYFTLKEFVELKSSYSKMVYKTLKQFSNRTGKKNWNIITLENFRDTLGVSVKMGTSDFNKVILKPILKELPPIFTGLKLEKLTKDGKLVGRGRKTHSLKFTWDNTVKKEPKTLLQNVKAKEDRAIAEANKRAKELAEKQHKEREEKINSKKALSELEIEKNKLRIKILRNGDIKKLSDLQYLITIEDVKAYIEHYDNLNK